MAGRAGPTVAAIAQQDPAFAAGLAGARRATGAVADQRPPQQQIGGRVDHRKNLVLDGLQRRGTGRLGRRVRSHATGQCLHKLVVKCRHLCADRLVSRRMGAE